MLRAMVFLLAGVFFCACGHKTEREIAAPARFIEGEATPAPPAEIIEKPPLEFIADESEPWQNAYATFLRGVETYGYAEREFFPALYNPPPQFYVYDIDRNGVPEIILITDDGNWNNEICALYTYKDGAVQKVGDLKHTLFGRFAQHYADGLISDTNWKWQSGERYLYTFKDDVLTETLFYEYGFDDEHNGGYSYVYVYDENGEPTKFSQEEEAYEFDKAYAQ